MLNIREQVLTLTPSAKLAALLVVSILLWATGLPTYLNLAKAEALTSVSDTLTDSDLSAASGHTINFTVKTALDADDAIFVDLDPDGNAFQITSLAVADFVSPTGVTVVAACGVGANEVTLATTSESFTLTVCTGDSVSADTAISLPIASTTSVITNPAVANSYIVRIQTLDEGNASNVLDSADTFVAIIDDVVVSAAVDSTFTFTISGVAADTAVGNETTSTTTSSTAIDFGILDISAGASTTAAQLLSVTTNARNGFTVTVKQDQNLTSSTGADIDTFQDGSGQASPIAWVAPAGTLDQENTYGHFGLSSTDDLNGDEFGNGNLYVGNFATGTRAIFSHSGPSDGSTADKGQAYAIYKIAVTSLQEAAPDYTNTLTYVATPTF